MTACVIDIPEILHLVFDSIAKRPDCAFRYIEDLKDLSLRIRELANFACVSRAWNAVATPLLWEILPHQTPLLKLLPSDCWHIHKESSFCLNNPAGPDAYFRFQRNQLFVRTKQLSSENFILTLSFRP